MRQRLALPAAASARCCRLGALAVIAFVGLALIGCTSGSPAGSAAGPLRLAAPIRLQPVTSIAQRRCRQDPASVPGPGTTGLNWCYHLASGLTLTRVKQIGVFNAPAPPANHLAFSLLVCVAPADRAAFVTLMKSSVGHQVAIVVTGRVLEAPTIQSPVPTTVFELTDGSAPDGFTRDQANRLLRRLVGGSAGGSGCWTSPS